MASTQIVDATTTVTITIAGVGVFNLPKPFKTQVEGDYVVIYDASSTRNHTILYSDVTVPAVASAVALEAAIHAMFITGSTPLPVGAATSANQLAILSAIQSIKDFEGQYVKDTANGDIIVLQIILYNEDTQTFDPPIYFNPDGTTYVPINPPVYEYVNNTAILAAISASLTSLDGKDYATQTTLAAILAKIIAAPATEAKQDTGNTSLAAILAKIIAAPATEAKQDAILTLLQAVADQINQPSTKAGRTTVTISGRITAAGTIYTVTPGKTFKLKLFHCAGVFTTAGRGTFRDNGSGGTLKIITGDTTVASVASVVNPMHFEEPHSFTTDVYYRQDTGSLTNMNYNLVGYEE